MDATSAPDSAEWRAVFTHFEQILQQYPHCVPVLMFLSQFSVRGPDTVLCTHRVKQSGSDCLKYAQLACNLQPSRHLLLHCVCLALKEHALSTAMSLLDGRGDLLWDIERDFVHASVIAIQQKQSHSTLALSSNWDQPFSKLLEAGVGLSREILRIMEVCADYYGMFEYLDLFQECVGNHEITEYCRCELMRINSTSGTNFTNRYII